MPSWRKVITSGSNASLNSLYAPSITGSLLGTSSYAIYAETASYSIRTTQTDVLVLNQSGNDIAKGVVVRITGSSTSSDIPRIVTASYENDNNSANTLGITTQTIANGALGYVITEGILTGVNTQAFTSGQLLYLGATGSIIGTAPVAPLHAVRLGEVIREQQNNGSIYVRIDNGYEIGELHDVRDTTTSTSYGDLLIKSASVWTNSKQLTGSYSITGSLTISGSSTFTNIGPAIFSGSVTSTGGFTGSLQGTAATASYVQTAQTASYVLQAVSASFATQALSSSYATTASYAIQALSASYAPDTTFPYTGSAIISGSLIVTGSLYITGSATLINEGPTVLSGSFKVRGEGNGFVGPFMAIEVDDANGSRKLFDADQGSSSIDFGNRALLASDSSAVLSWSNINGTYTANKYTSHYIEPTVKADLVAYQGTGGQILSEVTFDVSVVDFDLVYLDTSNVWKQVDQTTTSTVRLLGICVGVNPGNQIGDVFIEGDIVVTTNTGYPIVESADYGIPVYIKESAIATMSTVEPTTGTVRKLGFCYYNNGGTEWIMKFRPNN